MTEQRRDNRFRNTSTPQSRRIDWARSLTNEQMEAVLQDALLRARGAVPRTHEVVLTEEVVHELKSRLKRYDEVMGPAPRPAKRRGDYEDDDEDDEDNED
jgi:hypothetical protein